MKILSFLELAMASKKSFAFGSSHVHIFGFPTKKLVVKELAGVLIGNLQHQVI